MTDSIITIKKTITIKIVGLGGQGVVTAAALLAQAAFQQGWWSQSMPFFGVERSGTPVEAYVKIASQPIKDRQKINQPTALLINEPVLYNPQQLGRQLTVVNQPEKIIYEPKQKILLYDGRQISASIFNNNLAIGLLGAFNALWPLITEDNWQKTFQEQFADSIIAAKNWQAFIANQALVQTIINQHD